MEYLEIEKVIGRGFWIPEEILQLRQRWDAVSALTDIGGGKLVFGKKNISQLLDLIEGME